MEIKYTGGLRCEITHGPSGTKLITDAPVDNHGKGESFSPTDLVGSALAACMATIMGIYAERKGISLEGLTFKIGKEMSENAPRRIAKLTVDITVPLPETSEHIPALKQAAMTCPVHKSIHPEIEVPITWHFAQA